MKIVARNPDQLTLRYRDWFSILLLGGLTIGFTVSGLVFSLSHSFDPVDIIVAVLLPTVSAAMFWHLWCDVTACFDRNTDQIRVKRRRLRGTTCKTYRLSNLRRITFETDLDNDIADLVINFDGGSAPLILPARRHNIALIHYDRQIRQLVKTLRDWTGAAKG